jgi:uncharacterized protein
MKLLSKFLLGSAVSILAVNSANAQLNNTNLTLCGASPGGMWSLVGAGVDSAIKTAYPGSTATYQTSSGGPANVVQVAAGKCDLGIANDGDLAAAKSGKAPFKEKYEGMRAIAVMFDWLPLMWVARKDFADKYGITSVQDLVDKKPPVRLVFNRKGLLTSAITDAQLQSMGVTADDIKKWGGSLQYQASGEQTNLMKNGRVDMMANTIFEGHRSLAEIAMSTDLVMLSTPQSANDFVIKEFYVKPWVVTKDKHEWQTADAVTVTTGVVLFADKPMSDETAYQITKAIINNPGKVQDISAAMKPFKPSIMTDQKVVEFHPGAIKAYKEAGLMK